MNTEILILILLFAAVIAYLFRITYVKGYKRGAKFQAEDFKKELDKQIKEHYKPKFVEVDFDGDPILEDKDESVIPKGTYTAAVDPIEKTPFDHGERVEHVGNIHRFRYPGVDSQDIMYRHDSTIATAMAINMELRKIRMESIISTLPEKSFWDQLSELEQMKLSHPRYFRLYIDYYNFDKFISSKQSAVYIAIGMFSRYYRREFLPLNLQCFKDESTPSNSSTK